MRAVFRLFAVSIAALTVLAAGSAVAADPTGDDSAAEHAQGWFLVRMKEPLDRRDTAGNLSLETGRPATDAAIAELGVQRIDPVLRVSLREPRRLQALERRGLDRLYRFHVPPGTDVRRAIRRFAPLPDVDYVEPDYVMRVQGVGTPNDPLFPQQWAYEQSSDADVDGPLAWAMTTGAAIPIAVLDSGIDATHPDLAAKIDPGYDVVDDDSDPADGTGHGTQVASVAAAHTDNGLGIAGSCWNCRIMPIRALDSNGSSMASWLMDALVWATDHGAEVVNYSAGNTFHSQVVLDAIRYARDAGVVVVAAAGNNGVQVAFPARYNETIASSASDELDHRASFASPGRELDHVAPGNNMRVAALGGGYASNGGTSLSSPLVAGLAGLIKTLHPQAGRDEVRDLINFGAEDGVGLPAQDTPGWDPNHGFGRVNMQRSLLGAQSVATLRVAGGANTRLVYDVPNPIATSYDFIRGDLDALAFGFADIELGDVVCIENDSADPDSAGNEDSENPLPGHAFFYLGRFNSGPWPGSFGGSSEGVDRSVFVETASADLRIVGAVSGGELGKSVGSAGDVNDDGYDDVIAGAWGEVSGLGSAFLFQGSASGLQPVPVWELHSAEVGSRLGWAVARAGDVNGDGFDDVVIGESNWTGPSGDNQGRVFVYHGSATGLVFSTTLFDTPVLARFGWDVGTAGDVNNDGFDDVIVAAQRYSQGQSEEGRAYVFLGSASGVSQTAVWRFEPNQATARLDVVSTAGDVNGDGFDDVVVGASLYDSPGVDGGRVWLFLGNATGVATLAATTVSGAAGTQRGVSLAALDANGDGKSDVIIGSAAHTDGELSEGAAFIHLGTSAGIATSPWWTFGTDQLWALVADAAGVGDVDGDGHPDLMVGSNGYYVNRRDEGRAWLFKGTLTGLESLPSWSEIGRQTDSQFGRQVAGAGDVNGDGYDDVVISANEFETTLFNQGSLNLYYGSPSGLVPPDTSWACDVTSP